MGGEDCHRSSEDSMAMYMAGVVNGLLVRDTNEALQCLTNVTTQLAAEMAERKPRTIEGCHLAAYSALQYAVVSKGMITVGNYCPGFSSFFGSIRFSVSLKRSSSSSLF